MSIDRFLDKKYDKRNYNCAHLVCDVWQAETGIDLTIYLQGCLTGIKDRFLTRKDLTTFKRIDKPISPCLVLMNPVGNREPHVGVFLRGKVAHITEAGVRYQRLELATLGFKTVRFYTC